MNHCFVSGIVLAAALTAGCSDRGRHDMAARTNRPERYRIAPVRNEVGLTGRSVIECPRGRCVVLHFPPYEMGAEESKVIEENVARLLKGDPSTSDDDGAWYRDDEEQWSPETNGDVIQSTFNCCTFAVWDVLGLTTDDWIMPLKCAQADDTFPMQVILNSYFELVRHYRVGGVPFDWTRIEADAELQPDDVLCFVQSHRSDGTGTLVAHAGRICRHQGRNRVVSKVGTGPILITPIDTLAREYAAEFDVVQIYRRKPQDR